MRDLFLFWIAFFLLCIAGNTCSLRSDAEAIRRALEEQDRP